MKKEKKIADKLESSMVDEDFKYFEADMFQHNFFCHSGNTGVLR